VTQAVEALLGRANITGLNLRISLHEVSYLAAWKTSTIHKGFDFQLVMGPDIGETEK
jgi:hypothetical protein